MNILIFNWRDVKHPWAGGSEINVHEMAKRWVRWGNKVTMLCAGHYGIGLKRKKEIIDGIEVIRVGGRYSVYLLAPLYYLLRLSQKFDVLIDVENGIPFFTPLFSRKPKYCLVNHVHKDVFFTEMRMPLNFIGFFIETKLMPAIYKQVPFICISKTTASDLAKIGVEKRNIKVVYAGLDHRVYKPGKTKFKAATILYLGRLRKYKRLSTLIGLMTKILAEIPTAQLLIAGDGDDRERIKAEVKELGLSKSVKILGFVSLREKLELLRKSWAYVTSSSMEGWGLAVLEANACGTPALAYVSPGLSESIVNGHSGLLAKNNNEMTKNIIQVLTKNVFRNKLVKGAVKRASEFDWEKSAKEFFDIIASDYQKEEVKYGAKYFDNFWHRAYERKFHPIYDFRVWYIANRLQPKKLLDAGCGTGVITQALRGMGVDAYGMDISQYSLDKIEKKERKYFFLGNVKKIPRKNKSFDTVISIDVLEHIKVEDLPQVIRETARVAKRQIYFDITCLEDLLFIFADKTHVSKLFSWQWQVILKKSLGKGWRVKRGPVLPLIHHAIFIAERKK